MYLGRPGDVRINHSPKKRKELRTKRPAERTGFYCSVLDVTINAWHIACSSCSA